MNLQELTPGQSARILTVAGEPSLRQHLLDMGVIPGAVVTLNKYAPMGDPLELQLHGYELTLRLADAKNISVRLLESLPQNCLSLPESPSFHLGLGEAGKYHSKGDGNPLPKGTLLTFALIGNQNSGKTTLFNQLTGANQHVGNFPGVTVERMDGQIKGYANTRITDLPGIYSLSPYSSDEAISRNFILEEKPHAIINIIDATNIERNLYLTMQLLEMEVPMVVALNMMDELTGNGGSVDINALEALLGVPVVPIAALTNQGVNELVRHAVHIAQNQEKPLKQDLCIKEDHGGAVHRAIHSVAAVIEDHAEELGLPVRFAATKLIEGDKLVLEQLQLDPGDKHIISEIISEMETKSGMDRSAAMADMRYDFIERVCATTVSKPQFSKERLLSERIDTILTGKWTALPCFAVLMGIVFLLTFNVIGAFLQSLMADGLDVLRQTLDAWMTAAHVHPGLHSLVCDGIMEGVGGVLSFLPIVVTLFFFLSLMQDSGYMARVAFFMDKLLRKIGLSGRSIVPMLIGFGCTVPAVMSTRTLPSSRDRHMTILLTPFMSCSAKLPVYAFFIAAFFPEHGGFIMLGLYLLGILLGVTLAYIFKATLFQGEAVPFVMELPNYRLPSRQNVLQLLWEKAGDFLAKAGSVILLATIIVWFLQSFNLQLQNVSDSSQSILASLAGLISPLFAPIGLGDWRIITSLISGFIAKENVVSTMGILFEGNASLSMNTATAASMLVFSLLYSPCAAAIASIRRELGNSWALFVVCGQCTLAWVMALLVFKLCIFLGI